MDTKNYLSTLIGNNRHTAIDIRSANGVGSSSVEAYSFIIGGLKILDPDLTYEEIKLSITDNDFDEQIDAIVIKDNCVDIYDFKMSEGFKETDIRLFRESVDKLIFNSDSDLSACDILVRNKIMEARSYVEDHNYNVRLRVVRGGGNSKYPQGEAALKELKYDSIKEHRLISMVDLISKELNLDIMPIDYEWKIGVKKNSPSETSSQIIIKEATKITSLICRISLKEIVDFYHEFDPNPEIIFEANVRGLQNNKKVGGQILSSIANTAKAKEFYKLHNGLTIVCDGIRELTRSKYVLKNPQIVNGCQTVTTISEHFRKNRAARELDFGSVICKIFAADKNKVESICLASNSQVSINPWDLRTNDGIQKIIESYLNREGYKYDRKARKVNSTNDLIFTELGQWLCSAMLKKPALAKNSRAKVFNNDGGTGSIYNEIFKDDVNLAEIKKIVSHAIYVRNKIKSLPASGKASHGPANFHIIAGMYLLDKEKLAIDDAYDKVDKMLKKTITEMKKLHKGISYPNMFTKQEGTWKILESLL